MNKEALLKEIRKHPEGDRMLNLGYGPSFVQKMILEQNEQTDQQNNQGNQELSVGDLRNQIYNTIKEIYFAPMNDDKTKIQNKVAFSVASVFYKKPEELKEKRIEFTKAIYQANLELDKEITNAITSTEDIKDLQAALQKVKSNEAVLNRFIQSIGALKGGKELQNKIQDFYAYKFKEGIENSFFPAIKAAFEGKDTFQIGQQSVRLLTPGQQQDTEKDVEELTTLISNIANTHADSLDPELVTAAGSSDDEEKAKAGQAFASVADDKGKLDQDDVAAFKTNPEPAAQKANQTFKQQTTGEDDPFADLKQKYDNSEFMKAVTDENQKAVVYKFLKILKDQQLLKESIGNIVKALGLDKKGKKGLTKAFATLEKAEQKIIRELLSTNSALFIKMLQPGQQAPEQEPTEKIEKHKKEALGNYAESYTAFHKNFMKVTYLKDQGEIFRKLYEIILVLADKKTEDIDRDRMAYSDADPTSADELQESLLEEGKEEIIELYQKALIPQTNKMQRNTDKIMDILEEYEKYVGGEKDKIKSGSKALFQKYGEMDPKKLLFKVLQMTMKDIANLEEILDQYESIAPDTQPTEETDLEDVDKEQELEEALLREEKGVKEIIAEVKAVYLAIANKDTPGRALLNRAKDTATGKEREDNPVKTPTEMEESILREEDPTSPDTQRNIKDLALQVYEEMVKIRGYFPNVSPFGTDYGMNAAIEGLTKTLEGFNDIVLDINNIAKDRRVLGDISELKMKLKAIKENLKRYFGVDEFTKKAKKAGAMNDEGQKAVENGEAEPTEGALEELTDSDTLTADQKLPGFDGLIQQILANAYTDDDVVNILAEFFESPDFMTKIRKGFNFIKSKLGLNENEEIDENEVKQTYYNYMKLVLRQLIVLQTMKGQPKIKDEIRKKMTAIASNALYRESLKYMEFSATSAEQSLVKQGYNPSTKFSQLTKMKPADLKLIFKNFKRFYNRFKGQDKFKGVFVLYNLVQTIMLADVAEPDFDMSDMDFKTEPGKTGDDFLDKYSEGNEEKLAVLNKFFNQSSPDKYFKSGEENLEEQILQEVKSMLLLEIASGLIGQGLIEAGIEKEAAIKISTYIGKFIEDEGLDGEIKKWFATTIIKIFENDLEQAKKSLQWLTLYKKPGEEYTQEEMEDIFVQIYQKYFGTEALQETFTRALRLIDFKKKDKEKRKAFLKDLQTTLGKQFADFKNNLRKDKENYKKLKQKLYAKRGKTPLEGDFELALDEFKNKYLAKIQKLKEFLKEMDGIPKEKLISAFQAQFKDVKKINENKINSFKQELEKQIEKIEDLYNEILQNYAAGVPGEEIKKLDDEISKVEGIPAMVGFRGIQSSEAIPVDFIDQYIDEEKYPHVDRDLVVRFFEFFKTFKGIPDEEKERREKNRLQSIDMRTGTDPDSLSTQELTDISDIASPDEVGSLEEKIIKELMLILESPRINKRAQRFEKAGLPKDLAQKISEAIGEFRGIVGGGAVRRSLTNLILKMAEDDGPRFVKALGVESQPSETEVGLDDDDKPEQDSEKAKENQEKLVAQAVIDTYEEIDTEDLEGEDFEEDFADKVVQKIDPFFTPAEAREIDPDAVINNPETRNTFQQIDDLIDGEFNSQDYLHNLEIGLDNNITDDIASQEYLINNDIPLDNDNEGVEWEEWEPSRDFTFPNNDEEFTDDNVDSDKEPEYQSFAGNSEDREYKLLSKSYNSNHRTKPDANFEKDLSIFSNFIGPFVAERFLKEGPLKQITKLAQHGHLVGLGGQDGSKITAAYKKLPGSEKQAVDRMISAITGKNSTKYMTYITKNIKKEAKFKPGDSVGRTEDGVDIKYNPNIFRQMQEQLETIIEHYLNTGKL